MNETKEILISVVVPVYEVEPYINDCLESVGAQTMADGVECILVDDRGGDRSIERAEAFIAAYNGDVEFRIVRHQRNRGVSSARNTGVSSARGKYVCFLDSDDWITPDCLQLLYDAAESAQADVAIADFKVVGAEDVYIHLKVADGAVLRGSEVLHSYALRKWTLVVWGKLYRRDYLRRANLQFKEGLLCEDELWSYNLACTARSMIAVGRKIYVYRLRPNSSTIAAANRERLSCYAKVIEGIAECVRQLALQSNKDACLRYYTTQHSFLLGIVAKDPSFVKESYLRMDRACPFSLRQVMLTTMAYPRYMANSIIGIKAIGHGLGGFWLKLRNALKR